MSAEEVDVAATTAAAPPVADANGNEPPKSAESAPAVNHPDEETHKVIEPVQKRIDELTRRRYDAERDRDYWREQAMRAQPPPPKPDPVVESPAGKTLADFAYDEAKYQAHLFGEARKQAVQAAREELTKEQQTVTHTERVAAHQEREADYAKDLPDYFEIAHYAPISGPMAETIMESQNGPAIAYHLGKNPRIAAQIARLPPLQQAREIGRIEATLSVKPKAPTVSAAPPPAPKIAGSDAKVDKDPAEMSQKEFNAWRRKFMK